MPFEQLPPEARHTKVLLLIVLEYKAGSVPSVMPYEPAYTAMWSKILLAVAVIDPACAYSPIPYPNTEILLFDTLSFRTLVTIALPAIVDMSLFSTVVGPVIPVPA
jgi:hypothetical protein